LNERIIELIDIKKFWGAQDTHLDTIKKYYQNLNCCQRTTLKAFGEKEILDEFENRFQRLMLHFTRYNNIDSNVIERVILGIRTIEKRWLTIKFWCTVLAVKSLNHDTKPAITG
jgi:phosphate starvation-inducible PhoH-like protein